MWSFKKYELNWIFVNEGKLVINAKKLNTIEIKDASIIFQFDNYEKVINYKNAEEAKAFFDSIMNFFKES